MKFKIYGTKFLSIVVTVLGVIGTILSSKVHDNEQKAMKAELKDELLKELSNKQG